MLQVKRNLIAALAVAAAAAPSTAQAKYDLNPPQAPIVGGQTSGANVLQIRGVEPSASEFAWADAGIGAAATVALMGAGTAMVIGRRRQGRNAPTS